MPIKNRILNNPRTENLKTNTIYLLEFKITNNDKIHLPLFMPLLSGVISTM